MHRALARRRDFRSSRVSGEGEVSKWTLPNGRYTLENIHWGSVPARVHLQSHGFRRCRTFIGSMNPETFLQRLDVVSVSPHTETICWFIGPGPLLLNF